jgi:hypothetical protein
MSDVPNECDAYEGTFDAESDTTKFTITVPANDSARLTWAKVKATHECMKQFIRDMEDQFSRHTAELRAALREEFMTHKYNLSAIEHY